MRVVIECPACRCVPRGRLVGVMGGEDFASELAAAFTGLIDGHGRPRVRSGCGAAPFAQAATLAADVR